MGDRDEDWRSERGDGMEECKLSNKIPMPEMVSIPKSEYELLIEIKDCFIGGNEWPKN